MLLPSSHHPAIPILLLIPLSLCCALPISDNDLLLENNPLSCGEFGWTLFRSECYKLFVGQLNFDNASKLCKEARAAVVSIHSEEENRFIFSMLEPELRAGQELCKASHRGEDAGGQTLLKSFWIGYKRTKEQNGTNNYRCNWVDGTPMTHWANAPRSASKDSFDPKGPWGPGQPSGTTDWGQDSTPEECVQILLANSQLFGARAVDGQWNDLECKKELCGVICKKPNRSNTV